jgi:N-acetylneuraminate synthase
MKTGNNKVYIIAEVGVNHNGSIDMAKQLIDAAADAGADAVKFQTFKADKIISSYAPKAEYQLERTSASESQLEMVKKLELDTEAHRVLFDYCRHKDIQFLSTPFDPESLALLINTFDLPRIKLPSGEITNAPFLWEVAKTGKPVILSTGMSTLEEIEMALSVLALGYLNPQCRPSVAAFGEAYGSPDGRLVLKDRVTLLHCVTAYPAPFEEINLRVMDTMIKAFELPVGYSDHSLGIAVPIAAAARGAVIIEKHITMDMDLPGPDHLSSLEPHDFKTMVRFIRQVEKSLGDERKEPMSSELENRVVARKSLVAANRINQGELFTADNLAIKRPGNGISPVNYWDWIGKTAERAYRPDELIEP